MRRLILLILALATLLPSLAQAYDVLILQSRRDPAYDEVLKGFRFEQKSSLRMLVLADYAEVDVVRIVREDRPRMILAVGDAALKAVRNVQNTPVLAVMTLGVNTQSVSQTNLTGISLYVAPERYMSMFQNMKTPRVGVIYSAARSGWYLDQAKRAAQQAGIQLVVREVSDPRATIGQLASLAGKVDALWMLPDTTAVTRESTEAYFRFGQENSVPVVSFAGNYLGLGAAAVLDIDRLALGRQADGFATELLSGKRTDRKVVFPAKALMKKNSSVLERLHVEPERSERNAN